MSVKYHITETISDKGKLIRETVYHFENENEMENGITALKIKFNEERLAAVLSGNGIDFLNRTQDFKIE